MKLIQMQYSPDAFDNFIKQKLNNVEVDPSLADDYWSKMNNNSVRRGMSLKNKIFYLSVSLLLLVGIFFFTYYKPQQVPVKDLHNTQPHSLNKNKEVTTGKDNDEELFKEINSDAQSPIQGITNKPAAGKKNELKQDNVKIENSSENIKQDKIDIPTTSNNSNLTVAPVISKDSLQSSEPNVPVKKKKTSITIIW